MYAWVQKHEKKENRPRPIRAIRLRGVLRLNERGAPLRGGETAISKIILLFDCVGEEKMLSQACNSQVGGDTANRVLSDVLHPSFLCSDCGAAGAAPLQSSGPSKAAKAA